MNKLLPLIFILLSSCGHFSQKRQLTKQEMLKYNLSGNLSEAKICPTQMNNDNTGLVVSGNCEVVTCQWTDGKTECWAVPEKK